MNKCNDQVATSIREATIADAEVIASIYNWYIENTVITFELQLVTAQIIESRMRSAGDLHPWFVVEIDGHVCGFAYASEFKSRAAYQYSAETTIYLERSCRGKGVGSLLYRHLIDYLRPTTIHSVVSVIALPNPESIALHEKLGFQKTGQLHEIGYKFDKWIDVGFWQLNFMQ